MLSLLCYVNYGYAETRVEVVFKKPIDQVEKNIQKKLQSSDAITSVVNVINSNFRIPETLNIIFGGDDGPLYDPETNNIYMPYYFLEEVKKRFVKANYSETGVSINDATLDALMHTLFHEVAHAFIAMFDLPVLGKEEDAADSLASVFLTDYFEQGQEILLSAADLFSLESEDKDALDEQDFWGEHSLDEQRFYSALCHVYGSAPDEYHYLKKDAGFSERRADLCIEEYEALLRSWHTVLKPYTKLK